MQAAVCSSAQTAAILWWKSKPGNLPAQYKKEMSRFHKFVIKNPQVPKLQAPADLFCFLFVVYYGQSNVP